MLKSLLPETCHQMFSNLSEPMHIEPYWFDPERCIYSGVNGEDIAGLVCESESHLDLIESCPNLRLVTFPGTGVESMLSHPKIVNRQLIICNSRDYASCEVAEHTIALLLTLVKRINDGDQLVRTGKWVGNEPWSVSLQDISVGIVGLGDVGRQVMTLLRSMNCKIFYYSRKGETEFARQLGAIPLELNKLLAESDVVTVHLASNEETYKFIGKNEFKLMKSGSYFINTSRAAIIDTDALLDCINERQIRGAALDVFDEEPLPLGNPLQKMRNVLLSPHVGAQTPRAIFQARLECLKNLDTFSRGSLRNVVGGHL